MTCNFKGPSLTLFEQRFGFSFTILHLSGKNGQYYSWITQSFKTSCKGCFRSVQTVQWFIVAISFYTTNSKFIRYVVLKLNFVWSHLRFLKFFFKGGGVAAFYFKQFLEWFTFFFNLVLRILGHKIQSVNQSHSGLPQIVELCSFSLNELLAPFHKLLTCVIFHSMDFTFLVLMQFRVSSFSWAIH